MLNAVGDEFVYGKLPTEQIEAFFDDVRRKAAATEETLKQTAIARQATAQAAAEAEAFSKIADEIDKVNEKLREQIETFGMSQQQQELYRLKQMGQNVPAAFQEEYNRKLQDTIDLVQQLEKKESEAKAADEAKKKLEDMMNEGQRIFEQTRTPMEQYETQIGKLNDLLNAGAIDWDTYGRAVRQAREQLESADQYSPGKDVGDFRSIRTAFVNVAGLNISNQNDPVVSKLDEQLTESKAHRELLRRIAEREALA